MNSAELAFRRFNRRALIGREGDLVVAIEDVLDPDGRMYRIEYRSTADGRHAAAWCLFNPWGGRNGGARYSSGHVADDGFLCLGNDSTRRVDASPYNLDFVVKRSRFWTTAFSFYKETGEFPNPEEV